MEVFTEKEWFKGYIQHRVEVFGGLFNEDISHEESSLVFLRDRDSIPITIAKVQVLRPVVYSRICRGDLLPILIPFRDVLTGHQLPEVISNESNPWQYFHHYHEHKDDDPFILWNKLFSSRTRESIEKVINFCLEKEHADLFIIPVYGMFLMDKDNLSKMKNLFEQIKHNNVIYALCGSEKVLYELIDDHKFDIFYQRFYQKETEIAVPESPRYRIRI